MRFEDEFRTLLAMSRRHFRILLVIIVGLCIITTIIPGGLLLSSQDYLDTTPVDLAHDFSKNVRKPLDIDSQTEPEAIQSQISELERIKLSVRNELRELEKQRVKIVQETEDHKATLFKLQDHINYAKKQLLLTQAGLAKVSHELYAATQSTTPIPLTQAPPIIIFSQAPSSNNEPHPSIDVTSDCTRYPNSCLDYTQCPLTKPFKVFLQAPEETKIVANFKKYLISIDSFTTDSEEACLHLSVISPHSSLPPIKSSRGINHVLINLANSTTHRDISFNPFKATLVQSVPSKGWRCGHDILAPPITRLSDDGMYWKTMSPLVPAFRKNLIYYESHLADKGEREIVPWLDHLAKVLSANESIYIQTTCAKVEGVVDGWSLCGDGQIRSQSLSQSTFALILSTTGQTSLSNQIRLSESLQYGAIPVIIGTMETIYDTVIDWAQVSLQLPAGRLHEIHYMLRTMSHDKVLEMRRLGRFYWETYFSSALQILKSVLSIMRYRLSHLPPVPQSFGNYRSKVYIINGQGTRPPNRSPKFTSNSSVYSYNFWNRPPGPFFMYPQTPTPPTPVSGSRYSTMDIESLKKLPPHIVQAAGITGPYFEHYLLGDIPDEYFTVVMLTYRREDVVKESIERLRSLSYLAKVIVVWNDPDTSPFSVDWPLLTVPLEIVWMDRNSLNNRFIPYDSIQTEAVLSIDDDVYLRHDEIQFAFRVWRESRDRLVGFPGRFHAYDIHHGAWLYNSNYTCELSMVLTGAAFFHKYYSYLYTLWQPAAVREMVDKEMNCEDIAMNFLVSHITRKPPLKVTSRWTFRCPSCPDTLSQNDAHFNERHNCINHLVKIYGYMPLLYTQHRLDSILFKTRLPSHLEKCYQYV